MLAEINGLESTRVVMMRAHPGDRLRPTVDLPTSPMSVHLTHESPRAFERDYRRIVELSARLFHVDGRR